MGLKWSKVSLNDAAIHMKYNLPLSEKDADNIKNRINKRVLKLASELGTKSEEYKMFVAKAGEMGFKMTLVNRKVMQTVYKANVKTGSFEAVTESSDVQILSRGKYADNMTDDNLIALDQLTKTRSSRDAQKRILKAAGKETKGMTKQQMLEEARKELGKSGYVQTWFNENPDLIYEVLVEKGWERISDHSTEEIYNAVKELVEKDKDARNAGLVYERDENGNAIAKYSSWAERFEKEGGDSLRIRRKRAEQEAMTSGRAARRQAATQRRKPKYTI